MSDYDKGFNERWVQHPKPQATTEGQFWLKTGWSPNDVRGKTILDAGCGCGRFSEVAARAGARVISIDAAPAAVEATRALVPNAYVRQDNLLDIETVTHRSVHLAFALGTLHHTGDTARAFEQVAQTVRPGGELAVWCYCQHVSDPTLLPVLEFLHDLTRAIPSKELYDIVRKHAVQIRDLYKGAWNPLQQILRVSNSQDDEECISDTFDWHCPKYRDWVTENQMRGWFEVAGFDVVWVGDFPVSMRGRKRA